MTDIEKERERFEAWGRPQGMMLARLSERSYTPGRYKYHDVQCQWDAWQAAAEAHEGEPTEEDEEFEFAIDLDDDLGTAVEQAKEELPEGWAVSLFIEDGDVYVHMHDTDDNEHGIVVGERGIAAAVVDALDQAVRKARRRVS